MYFPTNPPTELNDASSFLVMSVLAVDRICPFPHERQIITSFQASPFTSRVCPGATLRMALLGYGCFCQFSQSGTRPNGPTRMPASCRYPAFLVSQRHAALRDLCFSLFSHPSFSKLFASDHHFSRIRFHNPFLLDGAVFIGYCGK